MNKIYIVDTNIIIAYLKKNSSVKIIFDLLLQRKIQIKISVITEIELLSYPQLNKLEEKAINKIIELLIIICVDSKIGRKAAQLRKDYNLKLGDSIIAATAITEGCCLISFDKIFARCQEIKIKTLKNLEKSYHKNIKS